MLLVTSDLKSKNDENELSVYLRDRVCDGGDIRDVPFSTALLTVELTTPTCIPDFLEKSFRSHSIFDGCSNEGHVTKITSE